MDWRYITIWFEQMKVGNNLNQDFKKKLKIEDNFINVEYAIFWHLKHKESSFDNLSNSDKLSYLELN